MAADIVHAYQWDVPQQELYVALGLGRDEALLYQSEHAENGKASVEQVAKLSIGEGIETFAYSPAQAGLVAFGMNSGTVYLRDFKDPVLAPLKLEAKQQRPCNSLSFNTNMLLAAGLDRARNDESVLVWDVQYGGAEEARNANVIGRYLANEGVSALGFVPSNPASLLVATYKHIRELDVRTGNAVYNVPTKHGFGLHTSPASEHIFLTYSESGNLALWDRRRLQLALHTGSSASSEPLLQIPRVFSESRGKTTRSVRFSTTQANELAVLQDGGVVRRWIISSTVAETHQAGPVSNLTSAVRQDPANDPTTAAAYKYSLFVNSVHDVQTDFDKVQGFDYTNSTDPSATGLVCIRQSGQVFVMPSVGVPQGLSFNPDNDLWILQSRELQVLSSDVTRVPANSVPKKATELSKHLSMLDLDVDDSLIDQAQAAHDEEDEEDDDDGEDEHGVLPSKGQIQDAPHSGKGGIFAFSSALHSDILKTMQLRASEGYSSDTLASFELLKSGAARNKNSALLSAWKWLDLASTMDMAGSVATDSIDLGFSGVYSIWDSPQSFAKQRRLGKSTIVITERDLDLAVKNMVQKFSGSIYVDPKVANTPRSDYRQLCLRTIGWDFPLSELESRLSSLEAKGLHEKAAAWAVFHGDVRRAVESLSASRKSQLRLMASAVAGYLLYKDVEANNLWREQSRKLASEMSIPHLRAIFAYIADGSWFDVLDDASLPLVERLGIALRFLPDKDLSRYLLQLKNRTIQQGDLEGILLTGQTPALADLLQSYVDKSGDVQTAALISSFGSPRYFQDERCENWIVEYHNLLNQWRFFSQRARFDVARNKLAKTKSGIKVLPPVAKQAFLRCVHCKAIYGPPKQKRGKRTFSSTSRCPNCNYPLPTCAVCLASLGPSLSDSARDRWPVFCMSCNHGYHAGHARQWFAKYEVCPVPDCQCLCGQL